MRSLLEIAALMTIPTLFPLVFLIGVRVDTFFLAPLAGVILAALAGMLTLVAAGNPVLWFLVLSLVLNAAVAIVALSGSPHLARARSFAAAGRGGTIPVRPGPTAKTVATIGVIGAGAGFPLAGQLRDIRLDWDARSIWLLHARWFYQGHDYLSAASHNVAFAFSHPDYPPAIPSAVAIGWQLTGPVDLRQGQVLIGLLNLCACGLVGAAIVACRPSGRKLVAVLVGAAVAAAAVGTSRWYASDGYADTLAAATAAAAVVYGLVAPRSPYALVTAYLCTTTAALTKNEGITIALVIDLAIVLRYLHPITLSPRPLVRAAVAGLVLAPTLTWPLVARLSGARSDVTDQSHPLDLLRGDPAVLSRFSPTMSALHDQLQLLPEVLALAVVCAVVLRRERGAERLGSPVWLWFVLFAWLALLTITYVIGPNAIAFWLVTSVDRTTIVARILLYAEAGVWVVVAAAWAENLWPTRVAAATPASSVLARPVSANARQPSTSRRGH